MPPPKLVVHTGSFLIQPPARTVPPVEAPCPYGHCHEGSHGGLLSERGKLTFYDPVCAFNKRCGMDGKKTHRSHIQRSSLGEQKKIFKSLETGTRSWLGMGEVTEYLLSI